MQYWVCYDIADDRRRERVAETLLDFGKRVQESVFQCLIDPSLAEKLEARLRAIIEEHTDKVHILSLCDGCAGRTITYGIAKQTSDPEYLIV